MHEKHPAAPWPPPARASWRLLTAPAEAAFQTAHFLVVPFAPGGPTDIIARILSIAFSQSLGQQVIVDNRAAPPAISAWVMSRHSTATRPPHLDCDRGQSALFKSLPYDPIKDFAPISSCECRTCWSCVRPINTIADLVAQAKANPQKFNYSSPGAGTKSHLTGELLKLRADIQMVHVPFRGAGPAAQAVLSNTVQVGSVALAAAESLIKDGQLRALAVTSEKRWFSLPDIPTMIEAGYPGFISDTFNALLAPAAVPPDILALLVRESRAAFEKPEAREQARKAGFEVVAGTPEQLAARIKSEIPSVRELVEKAGIKPE
jgi:tripartite-type tricarboxylate transporter receptor subunit TctC